jgi:hypothetical protein
MDSLPADILKQISDFVGPSLKPDRRVLSEEYNTRDYPNSLKIKVRCGDVITTYKGDDALKELSFKPKPIDCIDHVALHQTCKVVCDTCDRDAYDARVSWAPFGMRPWRVRANRFIYGPLDNAQSSPNHLLWFRAYVKLHVWR